MLDVTPYTHADLFRKIPDLGNKRLLDVGAGDCALALFGYLQAEQMPPETIRKAIGNIVAIDTQYGSGAYLTGILEGASIRANAEAMPFDNNSFEIVSIGLLLDHHMNEKPKIKISLEDVIGECSRVLRQGGHLVGDVYLHPAMKAEEISERAIPAEEYARQVEKYKEVMAAKGLLLSDCGIGYNINFEKQYLAFYFMASKVG